LLHIAIKLVIEMFIDLFAAEHYVTANSNGS